MWTFKIFRLDHNLKEKCLLLLNVDNVFNSFSKQFPALANSKVCKLFFSVDLTKEFDLSCRCLVGTDKIYELYSRLYYCLFSIF